MKRIIAGCLGLMMVLAGGVYGAELSWQEGDNLPAGLAFAPACVYNGKVYVAGGLKDSLKIEVEILDSWQGAPSTEMPTTDWYALDFIDATTPQFKGSLDYYATNYHYTSLLDYGFTLSTGPPADVLSIMDIMQVVIPKMLGIELPELKQAFENNPIYYYTYQIAVSADLTNSISKEVYMGDIGEDGKVTNWTKLTPLDSPSLYGTLVAGKDYLYSIGGSLTAGKAHFDLLDLAVGTARTDGVDDGDPAKRDIVWLGADFAAFGVPGAGEAPGFEAGDYNKVYRAKIKSGGVIDDWKLLGALEVPALEGGTTAFWGGGYKAYIRGDKLYLIGGIGFAEDVWNDAMELFTKEGAGVMDYVGGFSKLEQNGLKSALWTTIKQDGSLGEWNFVPVVFEDVPALKMIEPLLLASFAWNDKNSYFIGGLNLGALIAELIPQISGEFDSKKILNLIDSSLDTIMTDLLTAETYRIPFAADGLLAATTTAVQGVANYPGGCPILGGCAATNNQICLTGGMAFPPELRVTFDPENLPKINLEADLWTQEIVAGMSIGDLIPELLKGGFYTVTEIGALATDGDIPQMWNTVDECPEGLPAGAMGAPLVTDGEHFIILGGLSGLSLSPSGTSGKFYQAGDKLTGSLIINKTALSLLAKVPEGTILEKEDIIVERKVFKAGDKENPIVVGFKKDSDPANALANATKRAEIKEKVKLFDLAGVEVKVVADTDYTVDENGVKFYGTSEGKDLPSGIYIYQLEIEGKYYTGTAVAIK